VTTVAWRVPRRRHQRRSPGRTPPRPRQGLPTPQSLNPYETPESRHRMSTMSRLRTRCPHKVGAPGSDGGAATVGTSPATASSGLGAAPGDQGMAHQAGQQSPGLATGTPAGQGRPNLEHADGRTRAPAVFPLPKGWGPRARARGAVSLRWRYLSGPQPPVAGSILARDGVV